MELATLIDFLKKNSIDIISILIMSIIGIATILIQIELAKKEDRRKIKEEERKQQQILKSLEVMQHEIGLAMKGHLEELNKTPPIIPSYFIPPVNHFFYISNLNSIIKNKDTYILKRVLMKLDHKINSINRLVELAQNCESNGQNAIKRDLIAELKKENAYYHDLNQLLELLDQEWIKFKGYMPSEDIK